MGQGQFVIPTRHFQAAIAQCCGDRALGLYYVKAPVGARMFIGVKFYALYYGKALADPLVGRCLDEVEGELAEGDLRYLLNNEPDPGLQERLRSIWRARYGAEPSLTRIPLASDVDDGAEVPPDAYASGPEDGRPSCPADGFVPSARGRGVQEWVWDGLLVALSVVVVVLGFLCVRHMLRQRTAGAAPEAAQREKAPPAAERRSASPQSARGRPADVRPAVPSPDGRNPKPRSPDFASCQDKVLVIGDPRKGGGTGFLMSMDGRNYLVTNEHVTRGMSPDEISRFSLSDGRSLMLGGFEVAEGEDLVRFEVLSKVDAFVPCAKLPAAGDPVAIYGNSAGRGATTDVKGSVLAVGPRRIEVDAKVVPGNSGSPVLSADAEVLGVFTYVTNEGPRKDWTNRDTRFAGVRRWAVRFTNVKWRAVEWPAYCEQAEKLRDLLDFHRRIMPFIALECDSYKAADFTYGIRYDAFSRREEERLGRIHFRQLVDLSEKGRAWQKAYDEVRSTLREKRPVGNETSARLISCSRDFSAAISNSLASVSGALRATKWVAPQFLSDALDFVPMDAVLEAVDHDIEMQGRLISDFAELATGISGEKFRQVRDSIVVFSCGDVTGTAFVGSEGGKAKHLYTNRHLLRQGMPPQARTLDGTKLRLGGCQICPDRDLARFDLVTDRPALPIGRDLPAIGDEVSVYGNSGGVGAVTGLSGVIQGVGPDLVEVSAQFVQGNSGSPIVDRNGRVVAVASFAYRGGGAGKSDWVKAGTRFADVRRFGYRPAGCKWTTYRKDLVLASEWATPGLSTGIGYKNIQLKTNDRKQYVTGAVHTRLTTPENDRTTYLRPILHMSFLFDCSNHRFVQSVVVDEPDSYRTEPGHYSQEYISQLSREAKVMGVATGRQGTVVFGRKTFGDGEGFFDVRNPTFGKQRKNVELVCYHLEVWQNGYVVAEYSSKVPDALRSKGIPLDWYVWDKYPGKMEYR